MNFKKILSRSGQSLLQARANNIANTVKAEQEQLVSNYKRDALALINELTNLMDLSIDNTTSLSPVSKDFNPAEFVATINTKKQELRDIMVEWKVALQTYNQWFPEDPMQMPEMLRTISGLDIDILDDEDVEEIAD